MSLVEYIRALETCPDEALYSKLGVTHDWPVLVKLEGDALLTALATSDKWKANEAATSELQTMLADAGVPHALDYALGSVQLQVLPGLHAPSLDTGRLHELESAGYKTTIWVADPVVDIPDIPNVTTARARAMVILDLANFIIEQRISARFPRARMRDGQPKDTICYEPE